MQFSQNKVFLIGNTTKDPELRYSTNGTAIVSFGVATSRGVKKNETWEEETTFHNIVCFSKLAEHCSERLRKGQFVTIEGRINNRKYEDKNGITRYVSEIVADSVYFRSPKVSNAGNPNEAPDPEPETKQTKVTDKEPDQFDPDEEDIPF